MRLSHLFSFMIELMRPPPHPEQDENEIHQCSTCAAVTDHHRYKCVSCKKFNLCRACYRFVYRHVHTVLMLTKARAAKYTIFTRRTLSSLYQIFRSSLMTTQSSSKQSLLI